MAFTVTTLERQRVESVGATPLIADRRLYTDATQTIVLEEGDGRAAFVLCGPGSTIPSVTVKRLGLALVDGKVVQRGATKELASPVEDKRAAPPAENKAAKSRKGPFGRGG